MMTDEDRELLQQAMTGVTPLPSHKKKKRPLPDRKTEPASSLRWRQMRATHMPASTMEADLLATEHLEEVEPDAYVEYTSGRLTHQQMRKLRLGKLAVECTLDLHGCDFEEARALLKQFVAFCRGKGYTSVRVIHGKSHTTWGRKKSMKSHAITWLKQMDNVRGFASCLPIDGGTGAVYVVLTKAR